MLSLDQLLAIALKDQELLDILGNALNSNLVLAHPRQRKIAQFITEFNQKHRKLPGSGDLDLWLETLSENERLGIQKAFAQLMEIDVSGYTPEYVREHAIEALKKAAAINAVRRLDLAGEEVTPEQIVEMSRRVQLIDSTGLEGLTDISDVDRLLYLTEEEDRRLPTGFPTLDQKLGGGFGPELISVLADTGVGKTTFIMNCLQSMALHGAHALHVTFELWMTKMVHRYYRRIAEAERKDFLIEDEKQRTHLSRKLKHHFRLSRGAVQVLYRPAYSTTPEQLRAMVDQYVRQFGQLDVLALDYADLLASSEEMAKGRRRRGDEIVAHTFHTIRAISEEYGCTILNADQATREAHGAKHLNLKHMSNAYAKNRALDILLALNQTKQEADSSQARLAQLKMRDHPGRGEEIPLYTNMSLYLMAELDTPDTRRIMEKYGHTPTDPTTEEQAESREPIPV